MFYFILFLFLQKIASINWNVFFDNFLFGINQN